MNGEIAWDDQIHPVGVIMHELGHSMCNLNDLYDIDGLSSGLGAYSLMATGSWGRTATETRSGTTPVAIDAWSRYHLGWSVPQLYQDNSTHSFSPALSSPSAPIIYREDNNTADEFFLIENRFPKSWDQGLEKWLPKDMTLSDSNGSSFKSRYIKYAPLNDIIGMAIDCGNGLVAEDFPAEVVGEIALIKRTIFFRDHVIKAKAAGAKAAIIYNNEDQFVNGTLQEPGDYIPSVTVDLSTGLTLANTQIKITHNTYDFNGGLFILHVDAGNSFSYWPNNSGYLEYQSVMPIEASTIAGSLFDRTIRGHVTHLFYKNHVDTIGPSTYPNTAYHSGIDSGFGLYNISEQKEIMSANTKYISELPLKSIIPWVVLDEQWLSRIILFNNGNSSAQVDLIALKADGSTKNTAININAKSVFAQDSSELFNSLSGYAIYIHTNSDDIKTSFMTFNTLSASGRSPSQTTASDLNALSNTILFGYLPSDSIPAIVISAPEITTGYTNIKLTIYSPDGGVYRSRNLTGTLGLPQNRPLAGLLSDFFPGINFPIHATIKAEVADGIKITGTTFIFNNDREPSMAAPFILPPF